jgi:hypothetical protein
MTYEERMKFFCKHCHDRQQCGYVNRNMIGDCTYLQDIMGGWEAGYQDAVDKAAEWIKNNRDDDFFELVEEYNYCGAGHLNINRMVEEFKKSMEDK